VRGLRQGSDPSELEATPGRLRQEDEEVDAGGV
jgi:hypothetical protein